MPKKPVLITNMDGLEWKRSKYPWPMRKFLKFAEWLAAVSSDYLVADSLGIQASLKKLYKKDSVYIAYGAHVFNEPDEEVLREYGVTKEGYNMVMARFEPENNIDMVLEGVAAANDPTPILVIGKHETKYGTYLKEKFKDYPQVRFMGGIYNMDHLNSLRYFSKLYFHGHSVGGTNPSLLEAMASGALIAAHNNDFNRGVLKDNAYYFKNKEEVAHLLTDLQKGDNLELIQNNFEAITHDFNWEKINGEYLQFFEECFTQKNRAYPG
jgi:glycosyltransferase involved in cell wall biosynthesis